MHLLANLTGRTILSHFFCDWSLLQDKLQCQQQTLRSNKHHQTVSTSTVAVWGCSDSGACFQHDDTAHINIHILCPLLSRICCLASQCQDIVFAKHLAHTLQIVSGVATSWHNVCFLLHVFLCTHHLVSVLVVILQPISVFKQPAVVF